MKRFKIFLVLALTILVTMTGKGQINPQAFKLTEVMNKVSHYYVDSINDNEVVERTIVQMLHELDPHSSYLSKEDMEQLNEQLEGEFEGIGVSFNILEDTIYIIRAISGGPSERVGIQAGDRIVKVEGETVAGTGITTRDVQRLLKGPKGTRVDISIRRRGVNGFLEFTITRDKIPVYSLDVSYMVNDRIGYVKLARFSHTSVDEFEKALKALKAEGMADLILDLSGNGGGWLPVAVDLADHFLSGNKEIVRTEGAKVPDRRYKSRKSGLFEDGNLVIMIDGNSASASEIVSGAVQDWDRGVIVGRRSFGKGLVQQPFYLNDGSMIRLTVARYYTPTGRLIQKPYENGYEEYALDLITRYNRGELTSADSIAFPESQRYKTLVQNRTVYGGGGIMPDYFVPLDTSVYTDYYGRLIRGILNQFVLQYVDDHRDDFLESYPDFETYNKQYEPMPKHLDELVAFAENEDLPFNQKEWVISKSQIALLLKGYLARDLYGMGYFYEVYNPANEVFNKAVEILKNPSMHHRKLAKVEN
ncbi:MAG: S41 family peptidase [Bacteroidales bacterium]|nr:S41 family peptidase [Bacteroidales bacterium]